MIIVSFMNCAFLFSFAFLFSANDLPFSFLKNLICGHVFIQAIVIVLWLEFFLSSSVEETRFIAHLLKWIQEYFVGWWLLLHGKRNFRNIDLESSLIMLHFSNAGRFLSTTHVTTLWPSSTAQALQPIVCGGTFKKLRDIKG